jgi:uncharacterized protein (TIGR03083 family)
VANGASLSAMGPSEGLGSVKASLMELRTIFTENDLTLPVPSCPGWDLRALMGHLDNVHHWVCGAILEGHPNTSVPDVPGSPDEFLAQYDRGSSRLVDLLAAIDPDASCWTFGTRPHTARFWFRRQAHEHAIHLYDAQSAVGSPSPMDTVLAADGVDEVVTLFFPRQVRLGRTAPLRRSLGVRLVDVPGRQWVLAGSGTGGEELAGAAEAVVSGTAEAVYLLLWRRIGLDDERITVEGDLTAANSVLAQAIVS